MKALKTHKLRLPSAETATICRVAPPAMADASPVRTTLMADLSINETPHQRNEQDDERTDLSGKQTRKQKVRWRVPPASARAVTRHRTPGLIQSRFVSSSLSPGAVCFEACTRYSFVINEKCGKYHHGY